MARTPVIPMGDAFSGSFEAETALQKYMGVKAGTDDHQVQMLTSGNTSGTVITGINQNEQSALESARVVILGPSWARASGGVTRDNVLDCVYSATSTYNGSLVAITTLANALMIAAIALEDAVTLAFFKVMVIRQRQLST